METPLERLKKRARRVPAPQATRKGRSTAPARQLDLDYVERILAARTVECVWDAHCKKMAEFGFDRLIYGLNHFRTHGEFGDQSDWIILTNHDPEYIERFFGNALFLHAPMAIWVARNKGACSWRWARERFERGETSEMENRVLEINSRMGVSAGYSISFENLSERRSSGIGLCARRGLTQDDVDRIWREHGDEIMVLNELMNLKMHILPQSNPSKPLTRRQREVLQWGADGKTIQDIATIMGLNPATIEKHLRLARERLNAETTAQAVMKASLQNQFFIVEGLGSR